MANKATEPGSGAPATRLAHKRYSVRLPLALACRVEALCDMHPDKSTAQVLTDLLALGLAEVDRATPASGAGPAELQPDTRQPIYLLTGPFAEFHGLIRKHHLAMERELAQDEMAVLQTTDPYGLGDTE